MNQNGCFDYYFLQCKCILYEGGTNFWSGCLPTTSIASVLLSKLTIECDLVMKAEQDMK